MKKVLSNGITILLGIALIAVLTPLSQFLTIGLVNSDLETAAPVGWAVGFLCSIVLIASVIRLVSRHRMLDRTNLVLIYCMLTIAAPMMNIGLVRAVYMSVRAVQLHYVDYSVNTYRTAYESQSPDWFPVVPTLEGLAWNKANRILRSLEDPKALRSREKARRELTLAVALEAKRRAAASTETNNVTDVAPLKKHIAALGVDEIDAIRKQAEQTAGRTNTFRTALIAMGLDRDLEARRVDAAAESAAAAERLMSELASIDEHEICYMAPVLAKLVRKDRVRFERDLDRIHPEERRVLLKRTSDLERNFAALQKDVSVLSQADFIRVQNQRRDIYLGTFRTMDEKTLASVRGSFIFRSSAQERRALCAQNGAAGTPNQNLAGMESTVWNTPETQRFMSEASYRERIQRVTEKLPWHMWRKVIWHWGALFTCIFIFLMCLAEWLRRKWVDRENLAFPIVEIVDNIIRHDYEIETAADVTQPGERKNAASIAFLVGCLVGVLFLTAEALCNYNIAAGSGYITFPVSDKVFTSEFFQKIDKVFFVISPIAVGILFLVSLEISFSIWSLYFIYRILLVFLKEISEFRDPVYTGYGGGGFPYEMEQLLGASLCFTAILLAKMWFSRSRHHPSSTVHQTSPYVPRWLTITGLCVMPVAIGFFLWDIGVTNIPFMILAAVAMICIAIAVARVRSETGLPAQNISYEMTRFPIVFGMPGWTGGKVYAAFTSVVFLPVTLLFRLLPQQLENIELARRNRVKYGTVAVASFLAFAVAVAVGMVSFLVLAYHKGGGMWGSGCTTQGDNTSYIFSYPIWVSHFLGEKGLGNWSEMHWVRIWFMVAGAGIFGLLTFIRNRVMRFPFHPLGYILILMTLYWKFITPYFKNPTTSGEADGVTWLWGSALVAWILKKLVVKYGGMSMYRKAKPLFIGMVVGSIMAIFVWNAVDLVVSMKADTLKPGEEPTDFMKTFIDRPAFNPRAY